ncbi:NAD(P)H dehydrogenase (quinone) [Imtechella halotolerans K1]|uniref:NAD(P)H dehydrogenase (Quinone) n=2 Tax=Imtechella TaxID=1165076 RepID=I0W771_9FLAO|nr:NAD(P)H dehydrogenase (quinone) [Imtechella halotolerans K1]
MILLLPQNQNNGKMSRKILIINGHPDKESLNHALAASYKEGAIQAGAEVQEIAIAELEFSPNLAFGYRKRTELEPDLLDAWDKIKWADHLVWIHPVWWGGLPAITKGFIDRLFLPGFAFQYRENSIWWDKLLKGKTGHIITTIDQPGYYYRWMYGRPSINQLKKSTLQFCGISPVKVTTLGVVKTSTQELRLRWLQKVNHLGKQLK